ncbi:type II toxin-antitoxin system prevent-host-death family antitoxin [Streptomyces gardneri]|uniref:type II toxin-antitoxin system prevent-host-death family antitoxin n=2 Tax=Streptomyces gardneri TaxID=66892 RepID=UPI0007169BF0|nr:type II toxin-antitoxin system prevent-host-death family antitoxin [Streptomyces gardneri]QPK50229.1 type II toxin-antitoxin system prevent-host-death family antitoxin [Streptomyces gardneri]WRK34444.1 type II toxin-antitoxin system prevent-host-death family antitoxin [Streptomyces venezuelae]WRK41837.1 type II toxin-antitoxin system prevent-host-death family antitoxin [Streptomyces venezuelae]
MSEARNKLGDLIGGAASGVPQVLTRYGRPMAVLLPGSAAPSVLPPTAVAAGGRRRLTAAGDVLAARPDLPCLSFGLPALDEVVRGISSSRLTLIAAGPGAGGSLLAVAAARQTMLAENRGVFYAASGPSEMDVVARVVASHAGVNYHAWRAGTLPEPEAAAARLAEAAVREHRYTLSIDDGADLDAGVISEVAMDWAGGPLALVVVDRLQQAADEHRALSGDALPGAVRRLAHLARQTRVPVLAVVDSDDPALVASLDADVTLTLSRMGQAARIDVAERGMGRLTSVVVEPDIPRARFLPLPGRIADRLLREDTTRIVQPAAGPATQAVTATPGLAAEDDAPVTLETDLATPTEQVAAPSPEAAPPASPTEAEAAPGSVQPGSWPAAVTQAAAATALATPTDADPSGPDAAADTADDETPVGDDVLVPEEEFTPETFAYGPFAVIDGQRKAHLASGKVLPCPATTVRELVTWAADRPFGTPRLHPSGSDGDPLIVLTAEAATALGLPDREDGEDRALPVDHPVIADLTAHGWKMPQRGHKPWFSAWVRLYQPVDRGRRSVQLAILPWGALTTGGWPLPVDRETGRPASSVSEVVQFLRVYSDRVMTPVSTTAVTGQQLMTALRPPTRAWRDENTDKVGPRWREGSVHLPVDPARPEATKDHPLAAGREERDPAQTLQEEALKWWRMPTDEEREMPYVVGLDTMMAFFAACNATPMGTCAPYEVTRPRFDKKVPGAWLEDLSGIDTDPLMPSPFTPDGVRPSGPAWYETHTIALATELGHTPHPSLAYLRPNDKQAAAMGITAHPDRYDERRPDAGPVPAFGNGPYLKGWYEHLLPAYMETMTALGAVTRDDGTPLSPQEFLAAMDRMNSDAAFRAQHATDLLVLKAIKQTVKGAIGKLRQGPQDYGRRAEGAHARWSALDRADWRPDHRAAILARYRAVMNRKLLNTARATGARPLAVNTDCIVFASPTEDISWLTGHKGGFTIGPNPGHVKREGVQSMEWYLQVAGLNKNPASRVKDGRADAALGGK